MDRNECFPLFFAINTTGPCGQYKVFQNNIYQAFDSMGMPANILWPVDGVSLGALSKVTAPIGTNHTFIKKWNGKHYRSCSWTHSGLEVELNIDGETRVIPVLSLNCEADAIPFNTAAMKPKSKPLPIVPRFPISSKMPVMSH